MRKSAIFTMVRDEQVFLPIWLRYYSRFFAPGDIYVFNHRSTDGSVEAAQREWRFRRIDVDHPVYNDFPWYTAFIQERQRKLLARYHVVLFAEPDEILWHADGLGRYIRRFRGDAVRANGHQICHDRVEEPPLELSRTILSQRKYFVPDPTYCKQLLTRVPLTYIFGFHEATECREIDPDLYLFHLHSMDYEMALQKHERTRRYRDYSRTSVEQHLGFQSLLVGEDFNRWFDGQSTPLTRHLIPDRVRSSDSF